MRAYRRSRVSSGCRCFCGQLTLFVSSVLLSCRLEDGDTDGTVGQTSEPRRNHSLLPWFMNMGAGILASGLDPCLAV